MNCLSISTIVVGERGNGVHKKYCCRVNNKTEKADIVNEYGHEMRNETWRI
jgi:hypothetical protein